MRFKSLLTMTCTLLAKQETGKDAYNRSTYDYLPVDSRGPMQVR